MHKFIFGKPGFLTFNCDSCARYRCMLLLSPYQWTWRVYVVPIVGAGNNRCKLLSRRFLRLEELSVLKTHPEEVYYGSKMWCNVTHLPRKFNTTSWAPDDDLCWCQRGLLPNKCLVWQALCQLIKSHGRTVTVREEQGVLLFLISPWILFLSALKHCTHTGQRIWDKSVGMPIRAQYLLLIKENVTIFGVGDRHNVAWVPVHFFKWDIVTLKVQSVMFWGYLIEKKDTCIHKYKQNRV